MQRKIGIYYDENGIRSIMKGQPLSNLEQEIMMKKLDQAKAEFLQSFGFNGNFEIRRVDTNSRRSRTTFRIVAGDAKTGAILKKNPGWIGKLI